MPIHERSRSYLASRIDPNELILLDRAIVALRLAALEGTPASERLGSGVLAEEVYIRVIEMQIELCRSIRTLIIDGSVRSSFALLRTMFENAVRFAWMSEAPELRRQIFIEGKVGGMQKLLHSLKWDIAAKRLYDELSDFAHGRFSTSFQHIIEKDYVSTEADQDRLLSLYAVVDESGLTRLIGQYDRDPEDQLLEYGPLLSLHAFDVAICMLIYGCGSFSDSSTWWPDNEIMQSFDNLAAKVHRRRYMLWMETKNILAIQQVEMKFPHFPQ